MSASKPIFVIESNDFALSKLEEALGRYGYADTVKIVPKAPEVADSAVITVTHPIRAGQILDRVHALIKRDNGDDGLLDLGNIRVDTKLGLYFRGDAEPVRLTEKEVALLVLLAGAKGEAVTREALLENVWQYAEGVETHTLETHIYRLRQKIEDDPAVPEILKTSDQGYYLSLESA